MNMTKMGRWTACALVLAGLAARAAEEKEWQLTVLFENQEALSTFVINWLSPSTFAEVLSGIPPDADRTFGVSAGGTCVFVDEAFTDLTASAQPSRLGLLPVYPLEARWDLAKNSLGVYCGETLIYDVPVTGGISSTPDREELVRAAYGIPPEWLSGSALTEWYAARDPRRVVLRLNLIPQSAYSVYGGLEDNAPVASGEDDGRVRTAMIQRDAAKGSVGLGWTWRDAPLNTRLHVFASPSLSSSEWRLVNNVMYPTPFSFASWVSPEPSLFFFAADDKDSNGDGLSDAMALYHYGLNPNRWSTAGGGISDREMIFRFGLSPFLSNQSGDGYSDDEVVNFMHADPTMAKPGAVSSVRYYYDADGRLTGAFSGENAGAVTRKLSPANNVKEQINHP
ncbi:MAG: hypothetical protein FWG50_04075 [Kiritimatiellaeota bacterium]|nr:hypothetical protein [Kiritimatiellota bacterium]